MSKERDAPRDIYQRLIAQGTPEEEIEQVYRRLRQAGYGEEAAKRRLEAVLRRTREQRASTERRSGSGQRPSGGSPGPAAHEGKGAPRRRMEDWFPEVPPRLRRRINAWAHREKLLITGLRERWHDFLSIFRPSTPDLVNRRLLEFLGKRKHYLSQNPYSYSLATTLDALYTVSRTFLGRTGGRTEEERAVSEALRRRDPFAYEYLSHFSHFDETLRQNLAYLDLARENGTDVPVAGLARVTRETYRLVLSTEGVSRAKVDQIFEVSGDVLKAYGTSDGRGLGLADAAAIFQIGLENLQRFKLELYPVVLKAIKAFYEPSDESPEKRQKIMAFLDLGEEEILTVRGFYEQEARRKEKLLVEQQLVELESVEREKEAAFSQRFEGVLEILDALFPESGIREMEQHEFLVPYFDERVFVHSLPFDHGPYNVEVLSAYDPLQPVVVLHRIVDNMLSAVNHVRVETILGKDELAQNLADIKAEWAAIYDSLFAPYLRALNQYARGLSDEEYATKFSQTSAARSLEEEINQLRNRAIRNYGQALIRRDEETVPRLWSLVERLVTQLDDIGQEIHQGIAKRTDPVSRRIYEGLGKAPIVDFREHTTPGTTAFKPVVRQLRRYIEAKYHSSLSGVPRVAQLLLLDVLHGVTELYRFLLTDESSFLRAAAGRIMLAGEEEQAVWKRERNSRGGELGERLRIRLDEHLVSEYTDALTGLRTKNFYLQKLPAAFNKLAQSGKPLSVIMIDIDHFKWVNDELGHQKGDAVLHDAATTILDGTRRGHDIAIRYGGEEVLLLIPVALHTSVALAERLRFAQEKHLAERELYAPVASIGAEKNEPCGTFSVGVVERSQGESLEACVERADKALYESKTTRNAVTIGHARPVRGNRFERFNDYSARIKQAQKDTAG